MPRGTAGLEARNGFSRQFRVTFKKNNQKYFFFAEKSLLTFWGAGLGGNLQSMTQLSLRAKEGKYLWTELWSDSHPRKPDFGSPEFEISESRIRDRHPEM